MTDDNAFDPNNLASRIDKSMKKSLDRVSRMIRFEPTLQFFKYEHLPEHLQEVSKPFAYLAHEIIKKLPVNPERSKALDKLLEAKDCAVRAALFKAGGNDAG